MNHKALKKALRAQWPTLKKPLFGADPIACRDTEYPYVSADIYAKLDMRVWAKIGRLEIIYGEDFPDCDDFSDIKLGLIKIEWWKMVQDGKIPPGTPPSYGVCDGCNPQGEGHDFNCFYADRLYVSDYGNIVSPEGYRPFFARF